MSGSSCVVQLVLGGIGEYLLFVPVAGMLYLIRSFEEVHG